MNPTTLPRPLDPGEAFFTLSDQFSSMNFVVFAERSGHLLPEQIRQALDVLQQENALLQARIGWTDADGLFFEPAPGPRIALQCASAPANQWQPWIERELSLPFAIGSAPLMRCVYLTLEPQPARHDTSDDPEVQPAGQCLLALSFHHAIADGRAGIALLRRLLSLLNAAASADAAATAPPPRASALPAMIDLMPAQFRWQQQPDAAKQIRAVLISDYRRHGPASALPWLDPSQPARSPKIIRLQLPPALTAQLIDRARQHQTSVHGALCAAQLMAQLGLQADGERSTFVLSSPVDMRAHLLPEPTVAPAGLFVSIISATFPVDAQTRLWPLAQDIMAQTRRQISRGEGHLFFNLFGLDGSPVGPQHLAGFRQKLQATVPNTMISNVGAVATIDDDPATHAISFALCPMPYQALFTAASSYAGQLILNVGFDAAKLSPTHAQTLTERLHQLLCQAASTD